MGAVDDKPGGLESPIARRMRLAGELDRAGVIRGETYSQVIIDESRTYARNELDWALTYAGSFMGEKMALTDEQKLARELMLASWPLEDAFSLAKGFYARVAEENAETRQERAFWKEVNSRIRPIAMRIKAAEPGTQSEVIVDRARKQAEKEVRAETGETRWKK